MTLLPCSRQAQVILDATVWVVEGRVGHLYEVLQERRQHPTTDTQKLGPVGGAYLVSGCAGWQRQHFIKRRHVAPLL